MLRTFRSQSLSKQFLIVSFPVILLGSLTIGWWIGNQVQASVVQRMGSVSALFVDSFISPHVQSLATNAELSSEEIAVLNKDIKETILSQKIVSLNIWNKQGRILYSTEPSTLGKTSIIAEDLAAALAGQTFSEISIRTPTEQAEHGQPMPRLIETYIPIHANHSGRVIAAAEFYQLPDELDRLVRNAQLNSWSWVAAIMSSMYLCIFILVRRGSKTIDNQQADLNKKINELTDLNEQNVQLQERVIKAADRATLMNENFLQRVSADIHDGPSQDLGFALMQIKNLNDSLAEKNASVEPLPTGWSNGLSQTKAAIESAMKDLRALSADIELPDIASLSIDAIAQRVVRDFNMKTGVVVDLQVPNQHVPASLRDKIAIYRVLQESLANIYRHAPNVACHVILKTRANSLIVEISDKGPGFDPQAALKKKRLGLVGMRQRIEVLGGSFQLISTLGAGTTVLVTLPIIDIDLDDDIEDSND
jgi:signal transduction histidine kinase